MYISSVRSLLKMLSMHRPMFVSQRKYMYVVCTCTKLVHDRPANSIGNNNWTNINVHALHIITIFMNPTTTSYRMQTLRCCCNFAGINSKFVTCKIEKNWMHACSWSYMIQSDVPCERAVIIVTQVESHSELLPLCLCMHITWYRHWNMLGWDVNQAFRSYSWAPEPPLLLRELWLSSPM
jgi:hypothetical protein